MQGALKLYILRALPAVTPYKLRVPQHLLCTQRVPFGILFFTFLLHQISCSFIPQEKQVATMHASFGWSFIPFPAKFSVKPVLELQALMPAAHEALAKYVS